MKWSPGPIPSPLPKPRRRDRKMNIPFLNSFRTAAKAVLRRNACARRAESILNKMGGGNWSVSIRSNQMQALQGATRSQGWFTYRQDWLCFDVAPDGSVRLASGHQTTVVPPSFDAFGVVVLEENERELNRTEMTTQQKRMATVLRRIHARAVKL